MAAQYPLPVPARAAVARHPGRLAEGLGRHPDLREKVSTRAVALARDIRASSAAVTIAVHEHKRLGRGIELAALAEQLRADGIGLEFLTGELQGSHDPSGVVFTVLAALSGMEREYIRDRTFEGHESARARGKSIGGAAVTDEAMLAAALHHRGQKLGNRPAPLDPKAAQDRALCRATLRLAVAIGVPGRHAPVRPTSILGTAGSIWPSCSGRPLRPAGGHHRHPLV